MAHSTYGEALGGLSAPARNHYFYGKLLDVMHFQMEQTYFNRKRWLLNRLSLGEGVLCGLEVEVAEGGQQLWVRPGVAIDSLGREIIVPQAHCVENPRQPTDAHGRPDGDPIAEAGIVTLCLYYHECEVEPAPVLVGECDTREQCAPSTVRERYRLQIRRGLPAAAPGGLPPERCAAIFPPGEPDEEFDRHAAAAGAFAGPCAEPGESCVVLATVRLPEAEDEAIVADSLRYRHVVYSNSELWMLLQCLADRVDACCRVRTLRYVSGDAQQAAPGALLEEPLVVELVDGEGNPVSQEAITFRVRGGGGEAAPETVTTGANGRAEAGWRLGPQRGLNTLEASVASGSHVLFHALGMGEETPPEPEEPEPPFVISVWPPNAADVSDRDEWAELWLEQPRLAITFDRPMNEEQLAEPEAVRRWLRLWQLLDRDELLFIRPLSLQLIDIADGFHDASGFTAIYGIEVPQPGLNARYALLMRAEGTNILDTSDPALLLDAEFNGTRMEPEQIRALWEIDDRQQIGREMWDALVDTGESLPRSGDGVEGGWFHGWFEILLEN